MNLVVFGDELLHGKDSVGDLLGQRLGLPVKNFAEVDTSNSRIHKQIVKYIIEKYVQQDVVLIGWTTPYRLDAEYKEQYFTYRNNENNYPNMTMNKLHKYDHYVFDKVVINQRWASIVYGVQQLLEFNHIKYFMFNTQYHIEYSTYTEKTIKNFNNKLYFDPINNKNTMKQFLTNLGHSKIDFEAKDEYAKFLAQKFRQQGLIAKV